MSKEKNQKSQPLENEVKKSPEAAKSNIKAVNAPEKNNDASMFFADGNSGKEHNPTSNDTGKNKLGRPKTEEKTTAIRVTLTHSAYLKALKQTMRVDKYDDVIEEGINLIRKHKISKMTEAEQKIFEYNLEAELEKIEKKK